MTKDLTLENAIEFVSEKIDTLDGDLNHAKYVIHNKKLEEMIEEELRQFKNVFDYLYRSKP